MAITLISTSTVATANANITFSSIPQTYTNLKFLITLRTNYSGDWGEWKLNFNGSSANQYFQGGYNSAGSITFTGSTGRQTNGATSAANFYGSAVLDVVNYTKTTDQKNFFIRDISSNTDANVLQMSGGGIWTQNAAITSLTFNNTLSTWAVGSKVSMYGLT